MTAYTPNQLAKMCAVISRGATMRDWAGDGTGKGPSIQEVQCMQFDDRLYFGCNHQEHDAVAAFFNAFGVHDEASLLLCLGYTDWLLKMSYAQRQELKLTGDSAGYSDQELNTFGLAGTPPSILGWGLIEEASGLLAGDKPTDDRTTHLLWFLRRVAGSKKAGDRPKTDAGIAGVTNTLGKTEVNLLKVTGDVHAELKLLAYLYHCVSPSIKQYAYKAVNLGGLKFTCKRCERWIGHFSALLLDDDVKLDRAEQGSRGSGSGAGTRPFANPLADGSDRSKYINLLFNGAPNSDFVELDKLKDTALA